MRGEYLDLVANAPVPATSLAFDIGTGSGVLAAILARRGVARIVATDRDPAALACARENIDNLGLGNRIDLREADLFPDGASGLIEIGRASCRESGGQEGRISGVAGYLKKKQKNKT